MIQSITPSAPARPSGPGPRPLTAEEADKLREPVDDLVRGVFWFLGELESALAAGVHSDIWTDTDDDEIASITNVVLKRARKSGKTARRVEAATSLQADLIAPATVVGTRLIRSARHIRTQRRSRAGRV